MSVPMMKVGPRTGQRYLSPSRPLRQDGDAETKGPYLNYQKLSQTLHRLFCEDTIRTDGCHSRRGGLDRRVSVRLGTPDIAHPLAGGRSRRALTAVAGATRAYMRGDSAYMPAKGASDGCSLPMLRLHRTQGGPLRASLGQGRGWCYVHPRWTALRPVVEADGKRAHLLSYNLPLERWRSLAVDERRSMGSVGPCHGQLNESGTYYIPRLGFILRGWCALQAMLSSSMP